MKKKKILRKKKHDNEMTRQFRRILIRMDKMNLLPKLEPDQQYQYIIKTNSKGTKITEIIVLVVPVLKTVRFLTVSKNEIKQTIAPAPKIPWDYKKNGLIMNNN